MITITKKESHFKAVKNLVRCRTKTITSQKYTKTTIVEIRNGFMIATDGRILMLIDFNEFYPDGTYEVIKDSASDIILNEITIDGNFPKWEYIVPECGVFYDISPLDSMIDFYGLIGTKGVVISHKNYPNLVGEQLRIGFAVDERGNIKNDRPYMVSGFADTKLEFPFYIFNMPVDPNRIYETKDGITIRQNEKINNELDELESEIE